MDNKQSSKEYAEKVRLFLSGQSKGTDEVEYEKLLFNNVFLCSKEGKEVLTIILDMLLYNKKISLPEEIALHNTAVGILQIMGLKGSSDIVNKVF